MHLQNNPLDKWDACHAFLGHRVHLLLDYDRRIKLLAIFGHLDPVSQECRLPVAQNHPLLGRQSPFWSIS